MLWTWVVRLGLLGHERAHALPAPNVEADYRGVRLLKEQSPEPVAQLGAFPCLAELVPLCWSSRVVDQALAVIDQALTLAGKAVQLALAAIGLWSACTAFKKKAAGI